VLESNLALETEKTDDFAELVMIGLFKWTMEIMRGKTGCQLRQVISKMKSRLPNTMFLRGNAFIVSKL